MSPRSPLPATELSAPASSLAAENDITIELKGREPVSARTYGACGVKAQRGVIAETPLVLHFHGGNFVCGGLESGRTVARMLADAGAVVVSMAYPLAPLHPFPDAIEVGYEALEWLYKHRVKLAGKGARIYLAGEEAGGNVAAALTLIARDRAHPPLAGQILLSPMLDPCVGTASLREATDGDPQCKYYEGWQKYLRSLRDAEHPYAVPAAAHRLARLAPTLVLSGQEDPMRDEAMTFAGRLREAGIAVTSHVLASAENWPDALSEPVEGGCGACAVVVTKHFREFFEATPSTAVP